MGYFSQRKKHARENMFMAVSLFVIAIIYSVIWFDSEANAVVRFFRGWQFHFYLFNIFLLLYTLYHRKIVYSVIAVSLLLLNYMSLAKTARLFINDSNESPQKIEITYKKGIQGYDNININDDIILHRQGKADLSPNIDVAFTTFEKYNQVFTLISVDFSEVSTAEKVTAFNNLSRFVDLQDNPVIIIGDFGVPSWAPLFRNFLDKTELSVKNKILFTDGQKSIALFQTPSINILAYNNVGIQKLTFSPKSRIFDINLSF